MRVWFSILALCLAGSSAPGAKVLVWDHDGGQTFADPEGRGAVGTERAVINALAANGVANVERKFVLPYNLAGFDAVFVLCGFWPYDGRLSYTEQQILEDYLSRDGGNLYVEGTEVGRRYGQATLFRKFGAGFADDGRTMKEGNVDVAEGIGRWAGIRFEYYSYRSDKPDAYVDELTATAGEVTVRSSRAGNRSNARVVVYEAEGEPGYRVIVSSLIFGALADGKRKKKDLMAKYVAFFEITGKSNNMGIAPASLGRVRALFR
ncbi:MAG: hypothetical protein GTN49_05370 [candidate division Zixibacteria bacterium]|nr:hypothetical protein [candidate division Zixibacteria bacterium]